MNKWKSKWKDLKNIRFQKAVRVDELSDKVLLLNLYATQVLILIIGVVMLLIQQTDMKTLLSFKPGWGILLWGGGLALLVVAADLIVTRFVPEDVMDDGGVNKRIFAKRPLWHIAVLCLVVSVCEELLFRGAIQHYLGPYWTSILFAAIHVRYLQHWLMTGLVFSISYGIGWIYVHTGSLWTAICAHFIIDFISGCILRYSKEE
ncbi:CPBP family intramembrane glutamic endopeptidase [Paenibacillus lutrae]|uniref:CPBP family intramembrane metalloprotease n=1 Tax=Paenibacillus lutrae TaxID=2078573 RepID=A0A7X3FI45_9BACL|nr:CPBP family intramembrane glutamic endopeptidase [Paenibacillus lutrae]MVP00075.1 CPBP family intramembrane metalloprotease [Paenibacillus lutrae]